MFCPSVDPSLMMEGGSFNFPFPFPSSVFFYYFAGIISSINHGHFSSTFSSSLFYIRIYGKKKKSNVDETLLLALKSSFFSNSNYFFLINHAIGHGLGARKKIINIFFLTQEWVGKRCSVWFNPLFFYFKLWAFSF